MTATSAIDARLQSQSGSALGVFRILVGLLFLMHPTMKLFGWPSGPPAEFGAWPMWWAGVIEIVLGILIVVGLFTRVAAFVAAGVMAVAYFWMHLPEGFWPVLNGGETAALFCFAFLYFVFAGPGALAVSRR
ncbi:MAG: DoxX family protein [Mycobacterium sp.]